MGAEALKCETIPNWLKSLPLAPEYNPTIEEFQDPIAYILKIEKEASKYGICKIIPPLPTQNKKITTLNLQNTAPTFTTRLQQVGFCPRKPRPFQRPVWQSGESYGLKEFEAKAKAFEKVFFRKNSKGLKNKPSKTLNPKGKPFSALELEALFWKASVDKPFNVEYANDIPGSGFSEIDSGEERDSRSVEGECVGDTKWNMKGVARAEGSLLRFMKEEIAGVTSPMVYLGMLFSWFAWHVEDHDLHSLNYMHFGAGKTWYGVPRDAALAFVEVVRVYGYGGEINPLVTFATLGQKTTVMSPEVFVGAGIPCCRLVQNFGEFVVTFPGAYHSGFSHGFNCAEASNIATPGWLRVAQEAAIRRACVNYPPMVSHCQLLYELALSLSSWVPRTIHNGPRSSRLKQKERGEGETVIKELFVKSEIQNNDLLNILLEQGASCVVLPRNSSEMFLTSSSSHFGSERWANLKLPLGLFSNKEPPEASKVRRPDDNSGPRHFENVRTVRGRTSLLRAGSSQPEICDPRNSTSMTLGINSANYGFSLKTGLLDRRLISCVTCGILTNVCAAIVQPKECAAEYLMSSDCILSNNSEDGSDLHGDRHGANKNEIDLAIHSYSGHMDSEVNGLCDVPIPSAKYQLQVNQKDTIIADTGTQQTEENMSALALLATAYENSSDFDEEHVEPEVYFKDDVRLCSLVSECSLETAMGMNGWGKERKSVKYDQDSSRQHIFCLEHAVEVEKQLRPFGGVDILIMCHPDYPQIESEARSLLEELGLGYHWNEIGFKAATINEEQVIRSSVNDKEAITGSRDWAVKLGINLSYSSSLGFSPLYTKQMPYNSIMHKAFGYDSPTDSAQFKAIWKGKKVFVVGKWCGKVWMSNHVHPYLAHRVIQGKQSKKIHLRTIESQENSRSVHSPKKNSPNDNIGNIVADPVSKLSQEIIQYSRRKRENPVLQEMKSVIKKKRKETFKEEKAAKRFEYLSEEDLSPENKLSSTHLRSRRTCRTMQTNQESPIIRSKSLRSVHKCDSSRKAEAEGLLSARLRRRPSRYVEEDLVNFGGQKHKRKKIAKISANTQGKTPVRTSGKAQAKPPTKAPEEIPAKAIVKRPSNIPAKLLAFTSVTLDVASGSDDEIEEEELDYQCDVDDCKMGFSTEKELMLHNQNICSVQGCGKKFISHKYLVHHRRVHMDDRPLKCPWKGCNRSFKWSWSRTEHIRVHTGVRPYTCSEPGCGQTFRFVSDFSRHKRKSGHNPKKVKK